MNIFTKQFCFAFLLLTFFYSLHSNAQSLRVTSFNENGIEYADSLWFTPEEFFSHSFGNISLNEVVNSSGYLIEKSQSPFDRFKHDGKNNDDDTIKTSSEGIGIYSRFYFSALSTNSGAVSPQDLTASARASLADGKVPILLLNHSYNGIRGDALSLGLFTTNTDSTIFYDNPNRTLSPFYKERVFVGGPYIENQTYSSNGEVKFLITPPTMSLTDTVAGAIQIDFGDGNSYQEVLPNTEKVIRYNSSGIKIVKILQGGRLTVSYFSYVKDEIFNNATAFDSGSQLRSFNVQGAQVTEFLGCDGVLDKPVLIVEGLNIVENPSAIKIFNSLDNQPSNFLLTNLRELNYDIMIVKFVQNNADITVNAQALERVINQINSTKTGTGKLHVIGLSMGGLITKYCLKDMEDRSLVHQVENYFSYDSPHQGAYIPLGLQYLFLQANASIKTLRENPDFKTIYNALTSTAASQLLQLNTMMSTRNIFASTYLNKGYPSQCHKFAIANGRGDAGGLNYPGGGQMMDLFASIRAASILSFLRHSQKFWAINTTRSPIADYDNRGILPFFGVKGLRTRRFKATYAGEIIHESIPGSRDSDPSAHVIYGLGVADAFSDYGSSTVNFFGRESFTFVPTVSALDLNNQNYSQNGFYISRNPYYNVAVNYSTILQNQITPFEDFVYSAAGSQVHLAINSTIANFILTKIHGSVPTYNCNSGCITNPPNFSTQFLGTACNEHEVTMSNFPPGVGITWSVPAGVNLISGQGTNKIIITSGTSGAINLSVALSKPSCSGILYNVPVTIQAPVVGAATNIYGPNAALCTDQDYTFYIDPVPNATSYHWTTTYGEIYPSGNGTSITLNISASVSGPTPFTLSVEAVNACGTGASYSEQYEFYDCTPGLRISPNPANQTMTIKPDQTQSTTANSKAVYQSYDYKLYDKHGNVLRQGKSDSKNEVSIDTRNIPADNYFLHIIYPKETIKKQVIIQH